jgi:hypothetical protein
MAATPDALSTASPLTRELYKELLRALKPLGAFKQEVKKTSIHLARKSAFAGVHPRKEHLLVTIKAAKPIRSKKNRQERAGVEEPLANESGRQCMRQGTSTRDPLGWLRDAYRLCA